MSGFASMSLDGDARLMEKLRKLQREGAFKKSELTKAMRPSAKHYQSTVRQLVPRGTGRLRQAIRIKTLRGKPPVLSVRPEYGARISKKTGKTTSAGYHAHLVEFGTGPRQLSKPRPVQIDGKWVTITHTGSMPARPFLRPAYRQSRGPMAHLAAGQFWKLVRKKAVTA
jgi:HK97 gp10 family phage protein